MNSVIINQILQTKTIVVVRDVWGQELIKLLSALNEGGITCAEIPFGVKSDVETGEQISVAVNAFKGKMHIGAGTVITSSRLETAVKSGAEFCVAPDTDKDIISAAKKRGVTFISGAFTPSEVKRAWALGADMVKIFPANACGAKYFAALKAPLGGLLPIIAFGGITSENAAEYLSAGASGVGVGSELVRKDLISRGAYAEISKIAKEFLKAQKNDKN